MSLEQEGVVAAAAVVVVMLEALDILGDRMVEAGAEAVVRVMRMGAMVVLELQV